MEQFGVRVRRRACPSLTAQEVECILVLAATILSLFGASKSSDARAHVHPCPARRGAGHCKARHHPKHHARPPRFTGYRVEGRVSTFGYLTGDSEGTTADGGTTARPCIAILSPRGLGHWFEVTIQGHHARLLQCDIGPASWTGRMIDVTGVGDEALGFSPRSFPTDSWGVAAELR